MAAEKSRRTEISGILEEKVAGKIYTAQSLTFKPINGEYYTGNDEL